MKPIKIKTKFETGTQENIVKPIQTRSWEHEKIFMLNWTEHDT